MLLIAVSLVTWGLISINTDGVEESRRPIPVLETTIDGISIQYCVYKNEHGSIIFDNLSQKFRGKLLSESVDLVKYAAGWYSGVWWDEYYTLELPQ